MRWVRPTEITHTNFPIEVCVPHTRLRLEHLKVFYTSFHAANTLRTNDIQSIQCCLLYPACFSQVLSRFQALRISGEQRRPSNIVELQEEHEDALEPNPPSAVRGTA